MKISKLALSLTFGILWGIFILMLGAWEMIFDFNHPSLGFFKSVYIGYSARPLGDIIGFIWGFLDGAIFGFLFAFIYNGFINIFKLETRR